MTKDITAEHVLNDLRYLTLLARSFPTVADASTEIINLEAILNLPKGTEHFLSDIHGEHQAFNHVLKNASGAIKRKVNEIFSNTLRDLEKKELCTLIYYPEQKLETDPATRKGPGRLVPNHPKSAGTRMPERFFQIYTLKGSQGIAKRIFLHHPGTAPRIERRAEQVRLCGPDHQHDHLDRSRKRLHHRHV